VKPGNSPLISVVVPAHNEAPGIAHATEVIGGVLDGCNVRWEIIVVDDGSTDRSVEIARGFGAAVVLLPENRGEGAARNAGIRRAEGDAIAWLDADDYWAPHHIATVADLLERHPEAAGYLRDPAGYRLLDRR